MRSNEALQIVSLAAPELVGDTKSKRFAELRGIGLGDFCPQHFCLRVLSSENDVKLVAKATHTLAAAAEGRSWAQVRGPEQRQDSRSFSPTSAIDAHIEQYQACRACFVKRGYFGRLPDKASGRIFEIGGHPTAKARTEHGSRAAHKHVTHFGFELRFTTKTWQAVDVFSISKSAPA